VGVLQAEVAGLAACRAAAAAARAASTDGPLPAGPNAPRAAAAGGCGSMLPAAASDAPAAGAVASCPAALLPSSGGAVRGGGLAPLPGAQRGAGDRPGLPPSMVPGVSQNRLDSTAPAIMSLRAEGEGVLWSSTLPPPLAKGEAGSREASWLLLGMGSSLAWC
jgi:hypothetical protein